MRFPRLPLFVLFWCVSFVAGSAGIVNSLLVPMDEVPSGAEVEVNWLVANAGMGSVSTETPQTVKAWLISGERRWPVTLILVGGRSPVVPAQSFVYDSYRFTVPSDASGLLLLELDEPWRLRAALSVAAPSGITPSGEVPSMSPAPTAAPMIVPAPFSAAAPEAAASRFQRAFTERFAPHQPIYFAFGPDKPAAKFQFSFKYRVLSDTNSIHSVLPALRSLYFGYTQRSLWDITSDSSPFFDTSYMPEFFFESLEPRKDGSIGEWLGYQVGAQHESNGRDGTNSRSLNIGYIRPLFALGKAGTWSLVFAPKLILDLDNLEDNPDLRKYRGHAEYTLIVTKNDNLSLSATGRIGNDWDKGSLQLDLNYPLRVKYGNFATFLLLQYFDGYGESLLRYNQRSQSFRAGFGLVR